jgi:nitrate/nitrite transporter NarK
LVVAAGSLGLFPCYYSMAQDVSERHLGKASGLLGAIGWLISSPTQKWFGKVVDSTGSFDTGLAMVGLAPLLGLFLLILIWRDADR